MTLGSNRQLWICASALAATILMLPKLSSFAMFGQTKKNGAAKVEIKLKFPKSDYVLSEDIEMTVAVTNSTSAAVEIPNPFYRDNWQPVYTITGPSYPQGHTFSFRSIALNDRRPEPEDVPLVTVNLAPGETLAKDVPLHQWAPVKESGAYEIVAKLNWKGLSIQSAPALFNVGSPKVMSTSVGVDVGAASTPGEWVEWLHDDAAGRNVYTALFQRPHVDVRGYKPFSIAPLIQAGSQATDLLSPWTNYNRQAELAKWRVWREGSALVALATGLKKPQKLELGNAPRSIVRPALMTSDGVLDVFAVDASGRLVLGRFDAPNFRGDSKPAHILWELPIPHTVSSARTALSPQNRGSDRCVLLVGETDGGLTASYLNAHDGSKPGSWVTARIEKAKSIPNSEPALRIDSDGAAHAAIPFQTETLQLAIADLRFEPDGKLSGEPKLTELAQLGKRPTAAAAGYVVAATGAMRRDWVVLFENGSVSYTARAAKARRLPSTPAMPLQLVALDAGTYLLTIDSKGTPNFTLLD